MHLNAGRASGGTPHADDDWWTLCGELATELEVTQDHAELDCLDCLALLDDDDV